MAGSGVVFHEPSSNDKGLPDSRDPVSKTRNALRQRQMRLPPLEVVLRQERLGPRGPKGGGGSLALKQAFTYTYIFIYIYICIR